MASNDSVRNALLSLRFPLKNHFGKNVFIRASAPDGNGVDHILQERHGLTVSDVEHIPDVLANPTRYCDDPVEPHRKNYYGLRATFGIRGLLKIVTDVNLDGTESIVTIFVTRKMKGSSNQNVKGE